MSKELELQERLKAAAHEVHNTSATLKVMKEKLRFAGWKSRLDVVFQPFPQEPIEEEGNITHLPSRKEPASMICMTITITHVKGIAMDITITHAEGIAMDIRQYRSVQELGAMTYDLLNEIYEYFFFNMYDELFNAVQSLPHDDLSP